MEGSYKRSNLIIFSLMNKISELALWADDHLSKEKTLVILRNSFRWDVPRQLQRWTGNGALERGRAIKLNSSWVLSVPTWNLLEQTTTKRTLGHFLQGITADKGPKEPRPQSPMSGSLFYTCQTSIRRHVAPHVNEHPLLETVSSSTATRQLLDKLPLERKWMAEWPAHTGGWCQGQIALPTHQCHPPGWVIHRLASGFPRPLWMVLLSMRCFTSTWPPLLGTPELCYSLPHIMISWAYWSQGELSPEWGHGAQGCLRGNDPGQRTDVRAMNLKLIHSLNIIVVVFLRIFR